MYTQNRNRFTDTETNVVTKGEREGGEGQIRGMRLTNTNYYV